MEKTKCSEAYRIQKHCMALTGIWPHRTTSRFYKTYGILNYIFVSSFGLSLLLSTMVENDLAKLIHGWSMFCAIINCNVKVAVFYLKKDMFMDMIESLKLHHFSYYNIAYDKYLEKTVYITKFMVKAYICCVIATVLCILLAPLLSNLELRQTPLPFPLDLTNYHIIVYLLVYLYQCTALCSAALFTIGLDNLSMGMIGISSAYFKILRDTILEVLNNEVIKNGKSNKNMYDSYRNKEKDIFKQLGDCVSHHTALIEFTKSIENTFTYIFLIQFLCSAAGICLVGFAFMNAAPGSMEFLFALSFLATWMLLITSYCVYGNAITVASYEIGDACYMSEWIYCGRLVRQSLFLIMERSKRPLTLTAGKFIELSLISLVAVLKTSASYMAVLRQMTE